MRNWVGHIWDPWGHSGQNGLNFSDLKVMGTVVQKSNQWWKGFNGGWQGPHWCVWEMCVENRARASFFFLAVQYNLSLYVRIINNCLRPNHSRCLELTSLILVKPEALITMRKNYSASLSFMEASLYSLRGEMHDFPAEVYRSQPLTHRSSISVAPLEYSSLIVFLSPPGPLAQSSVPKSLSSLISVWIILTHFHAILFHEVMNLLSHF